MSKRVPMTRARQEALPTILAAARASLAARSEPLDKDGKKLAQALEAFQ